MDFDMAIIGAGVIGCNIARVLSRYNQKICVLEKEFDIGQRTSGANSGIIHGGYDAKPGSLKALLNVRAVEMFDELARDLAIKYIKTGSLVLAFTDSDVNILKSLYKRGLRNGVKGISLIGREELFNMEPNINREVVMALRSINSGIINPYEFTWAAAEMAEINGTEFIFGARVIAIEKKNDCFHIKTAEDTVIRARYVINCGGVYADRIAAMVDASKYRVKPRKGVYLLMDKKEGSRVGHVIFQTPSRMGKGILVSPTAEGNLLLGPNAADIGDKEDDTVDRDGLEEVIRGASRSVSGIDLKHVITTFAGLRAVSSTGDFVIKESMENFINVLGIESPGLTAAPAIAEYVRDLVRDRLKEKKSYVKKRKPFPRIKEMTTEDANTLIKRDNSYGNIICRCENVSEGEIREAIRRPVGARTVDGVKKRARAGMGRCQGGFCLPKVLEILASELGEDPVNITKSGGSSRILTGRTKEEVTYDEV